MKQLGKFPEKHSDMILTAILIGLLTLLSTSISNNLFGIIHMTLFEYLLINIGIIVGIVISIWICITGFKIFMESYNILMDKSIDPKTEEIITDIAHNYKEIQKLDAISSTPVGYKYIVVLTICVDGNMSTFDSHKLADSLEKDIKKLDNVSNAIIHVNPV